LAVSQLGSPYYERVSKKEGSMERDAASIRSLAGLNFLFGAWLIISPYILNYTSTQAKWQQTIIGIIVAAMAAIRYFAADRVWASWVNAIAGLWMIITPFASNFQPTRARWNAVIFGILIGIVALVNASQRAPAGGRHHPAT
jgi:hypothetical protein